ncbi:kinetochore protein spc24 [Colletotrichum sojae]|uniref:Kinetochore protein Spc24 n=1 Tax=Colletotrichum sojae TaxID=2175907 RepID=A0A8H6JFD3_9PEZI|nr:kinetochore protein spc24 [Colletotrichum sojae]
MLLAEEPATLIHHTIANFNIQPDKQAVTRINGSLETLQQARELRLREAEDALKSNQPPFPCLLLPQLLTNPPELTRQLNTMSSQHAELTSSHSSAAHASEIARLDTTKFRTAKAASDAEMEAERLAQQAADLAARLQELELQGVDGDPDDRQRRRDPVDDEVLLRLKVYRSLGIEIERDGRDGEFSRAVVRNDRKGDVHVVNMDPKFSKFFYANYFWQTL